MTKPKDCWTYARWKEAQLNVDDRNAGHLGGLTPPAQKRLGHLITRCVRTGKVLGLPRLVRYVMESNLPNGAPCLIFQDMKDRSQHAVAWEGTVAWNEFQEMPGVGAK